MLNNSIKKVAAKKSWKLTKVSVLAKPNMLNDAWLEFPPPPLLKGGGYDLPKIVSLGRGEGGGTKYFARKGE